MSAPVARCLFQLQRALPMKLTVMMVEDGIFEEKLQGDWFREVVEGERSKRGCLGKVKWFSGEGRGKEKVKS